MNTKEKNLTPKEIVSALDKYVIGQHKAKRAVAVALRNRWRRKQIVGALRDEVVPKNILMIGPTGVGKTEIARRLARLADAPFIKVEATKYTEVGYVGRDVESIIRDLVETALGQVRETEMVRVHVQAEAAAEENLLDLLLPGSRPKPAGGGTQVAPGVVLPRMFFNGEDDQEQPEPDRGTEETNARTREKFRTMLRDGKFDEREVEIEVSGGGGIPMLEIGGGESVGINLKEIYSQMTGSGRKRKKVKVKDARRMLIEERAADLVDQEKVREEAVNLVEDSGIVFIDEMDKIAEGGTERRGGPDVSRAGVQRDLLPLIEGTTVTTKHGQVRTDHILFIGAGAFHFSKPSDLIPEMQGRFPIRVELDSLTKDDFIRILHEPDNALTKQYTALLEAEEITLVFTEDAIEELAEIATRVNDETENIGARRLHTILEYLLEEVSYEGPELRGQTITVNRGYVQQRLTELAGNQDLARYIL